MTVLLTDGGKDPKAALHRILDIYLSDTDAARGFFIKPNIVFPVREESGEITPPGLVKALIEVLRERYGNVDIILGEGVAAGCDPEENFRVSGYTDLARELNVPLLDLHNVERMKVEWKFGTLELPRVVIEHTYINLPILKPSSACVISGALKNQKGLLSPALKKRFHRMGLHEQIAELNLAVKPSLTIMDGRIFFGRNKFVSGENCGEIDATICDLLDIEIPEHVQQSRDAHLFTEGYLVKGDEFKVKQAFARPGKKEFKSVGRLRLWSNPQACTMCRYLFRDIQRNILNCRNLVTATKLLPYSIKGAEIIMGSNAQWRKEYNTVICVGSCTRRVAKEGDYIYIPGCPPTPDDLNENLP